MTLGELEVFLDSLGEKKFRGKQIYSWMYRGASDFNEMTDLSKQLREKLAEVAEIESLAPLKVQTSKTDGTRKYLFGLSDGNAIESVFMKYKYGNSACISSQAGCRMGCAFCASGQAGLARNLTASEMADQIISMERDTKERIGHVVVMGTGEPFDNYPNLSTFIQLIHEKEGLNLGLRNITVSTCGLIPKIQEFAKDFPQVNLAISLHAPNDNLRNHLMPINRQYPLASLLVACKKHIEITRRRMTFEYILIGGLNDTEKHALELAEKLRGMMCHVNLISMNKIFGTKFSGSSKKMAEQFKGILEKKGIEVTLRRELGTDIQAACGQLRLEQMEE